MALTQEWMDGVIKLVRDSAQSRERIEALALDLDPDERRFASALLWCTNVSGMLRLKEVVNHRARVVEWGEMVHQLHESLKGDPVLWRTRPLLEHSDSDNRWTLKFVTSATAGPTKTLHVVHGDNLPEVVGTAVRELPMVRDAMREIGYT